MTDAGDERGVPPAADDDAIAERAAELATEVTEADEPEERRRLMASLASAVRTGVRATGSRTRAAASRTRAVTSRTPAAASPTRAVTSRTPAAASRTRAVTSRTRAAASRTRVAAGSRTRAAGHRLRLGTGWLAVQVVAMAPRLRVRDRAALQAQFPGLPTEDIADALIKGAARASGTVGAGIGAWAALPTLPAFPVEVVTETLALVGIEIKLVAELHEAYGMPAPGTGVERMNAYVAAWAHRRGVFLIPGGLILAAGSPLARRLQRRLAARASRTVFSLGPLFTGSLAGALLNSRETRRLGEDVRADLRHHALAAPQWYPLN
jgi:hypothetical protein